MSLPVNVLVVDDEAIMRSLITDILQEKGIQTISVTNGKEALDKMEEMSFSAVFLDVHMPVMNGLETLKAIKKMFPGMPVAMMDSYPDQLVAESLREGVVACMHKPFIIREVEDIIDKIIE